MKERDIGRGAASALCQQASSSPDLDSLKKQALAEGEAGAVDAAIRDYGRALALDPDWRVGWFNLGTIEYTADRFPDARSSFERVVGFAPDLGTAWRLLGLSEFETKDFANALTHLERAQSLGVDEDPEIQRVATYHLALLLIRGGSFERASDLLRSAFGDGAVSSQVRYALGLALLRVTLLPNEVDPSREATILAAGDLAVAHDTSLAGFPVFLAAHPDLPYAHYAYGLALGKARRDREALVQLTDETRISSASPLPWVALDQIQSRLGQAQEARSSASRAKALGDANAPDQRMLSLYGLAGPAKPDHAGDDALFASAMQHYSAAEYAAAIAELKQWLRANPENGTAWAVLGLSEYAAGDLGSARLHLERGEALGLRGSAASLETARYTLAILLIHAGDFDPAAHLLNAARTPTEAKTEYALGLALLRRPELPPARRPELPSTPDGAETALVRASGKIAVLLNNSQYDQALAQFRQLLVQYPSAPFLHYAYGTALLALSEFTEAAAQMRAETAISPGSDLPYLRLASIALRRHQPAEALDPARHALSLAPQSAGPTTCSVAPRSKPATTPTHFASSRSPPV